MDVVKSTLKLYEWFSSNDSFCIEDDFLDIVTITENPERDKASVLCALNNLEKYEMIQSVEVSFKKEKRKVWTLEKSFDSMPQKVEIDSTLAVSIARIINECAERFNATNVMCDVSNITAENIKDLTILAGITLKEEESLDNEL